MPIKGFKESKKPTAAQLERRLNNALIHIDLTKDTRSVYFSDKGLRLVDTDDYVLVQTGFHTHVFSKITSSGYSRPCLYVSRLVDFALGNDCQTKNGLSYSKLFDVLKKKEDHTEFNIATYADWWLSIVFAPLYAIDENAASQFNVYHKYVSHLVTQQIFMSEHKNGMTNKEFVSEHAKLMDEFLRDIQEAPIFEPLSDEQRAQQEMDALRQDELDSYTKEQDE